MNIAVVDGQGGGIGKQLIESLRKELGDAVHILALGTNSLATSAMLKAGANDGATGENAVVLGSSRADFILGSAGILCANAMLGELTPAMAVAIGASSAKKLLIPLNRCSLYFVGAPTLSVQEYIAGIVAFIKQELP